MTDKVTKKRRGFCFVTYISEDSVDKCTEQTFHNVDDTQVIVLSPAKIKGIFFLWGGGGRLVWTCDHIKVFFSLSILALRKMKICTEGNVCYDLYIYVCS